jgi:hypothetical protein
MSKINYRKICGIKVMYTGQDGCSGTGSSFPLPLSELAKGLLIRRIEDNEIKKIVIKKVKL